MEYKDFDGYGFNDLKSILDNYECLRVDSRNDGDYHFIILPL